MHPEPNRRIIRVFISSPSDVAEERDRARQVIEGLRRRYSRKFLLKPVMWEDFALQLDVSFQQGIELVLSQDQGIDIAVFILWSRLGSAIGPLVRNSDGGEYRSGTERELDLMLAARRQSGGKRPSILAYTRRDESSFEERLRGKPTGEKGELITQKRLVESFIAETFQDQAMGHNTRAFHSFDRPVAFSQRLRVHLVELLDQLAGAMTETVWDFVKQGPPFLGLSAFQPEHADVFFGREEETLEARFALREQAKQGCPFLLLTGASGSGKSSLARSGILPDIVQNELDEQVVEWRQLIVTPAELAADPTLALLQRLASPDVLPELQSQGTSLEKFASGLRDHPQLTFDLAMQPIFDRLATQHQGSVRLLLVVDQLEELFASHVMTLDDRRALLSVIETFVRSGSVWVLATVRSDFYHQIQGETVLVRMLENRGPLPVLLPGPEALQRLIEEPARMAGLRYEVRDGVSLASRILRDAAAHVELLPLVEFVLRELFETREDDGLLTIASYDRLGGVEGAVGKQAEETVLGLPAESQAALAAILPLLVTVETEGDQSAVRRRASLAALRWTAASEKLVDSLIAKRFLTTDQQGASPVASLAHETLLRSWPRIANWITANREHLRLRARVEQSQQRWEQQGRHNSLLLPDGLPLEEGRQLLAEGAHLLSPSCADFIRASIEVHRRAAAHVRRVRQAVIGALSVLTVFSLIGGAWAWRAQVSARDAEKTAEQRKEEAIKSKDELTQQLYDNSIAIAEREITQNHDIGKASALLQGETCPESLRGWEWHYLMRLRDGGRAPLAGPDGHKTGLWGAEFSPDGSLIATCSIDGTLKLWDAKSGRMIKSVDADQMELTSLILNLIGVSDIPIMCLSFSPDGKTIATGSFLPRPKLAFPPTPDPDSPGLVRIWSVEGDLLSSFQDQLGVVLSLTFSPDGKQIASSSINSDNSFVVWDVKTSRVIKRVLGHKSQIHRLRYRPDGKVLAAGETDGAVKLWNTSTFEEVLNIEAHTAPVTGICFSPDNGSRMATSGEDGLVRVWETGTGKLLLDLEGHAGAAIDVRYSPDGSRIASSGFDKTVRLWDAVTGKAKLTLRGHEELVWSVAFSPDGQQLVSASFDNTARIWDASPRPVQETAGEFTVGGHTERANCVAFSSVTDLLVTGSWDRTIRLWNSQTGDPISKLEGHRGTIWSVAISPDGERIASASWDHTAKVWDRGTGKVITTFSGHTAPVHSVAFSPDGSRVASGAFDGQLKIWEASTGKLKASCDGFIFPVMAVAFSHDGKQVASGGSDRTVNIWNAESGAKLLSLKTHTASIHGLAYSSDDKRVASASWDHTVRIWDVELVGDAGRNRELRILEGHDDRVNAIAFSPDGKRIASASEDKTVKIWDVDTGKQIGPEHRHRAVVWSVAFAKEGNRLVSACWEKDRWIHAWNLPQE